MPYPNGWLCHVVCRCILKHHAISTNDCLVLLRWFGSTLEMAKFSASCRTIFPMKISNCFLPWVGCHLSDLENRDHNRDHFNSPSCCKSSHKDCLKTDIFNSSPFGGGICRGLEILTSWFWPVPIILCTWGFSALSTTTYFTSFFVSSPRERETKTGQKRRCNERQLQAEGS